MGASRPSPISSFNSGPFCNHLLFVQRKTIAKKLIIFFRGFSKFYISYKPFPGSREFVSTNFSLRLLETNRQTNTQTSKVYR